MNLVKWITNAILPFAQGEFVKKQILAKRVKKIVIVIEDVVCQTQQHGQCMHVHVFKIKIVYMIGNVMQGFVNLKNNAKVDKRRFAKKN